MQVGVLEDDPDQQALALLWLGEAGHAPRAFGTVGAMLRGLAGTRFDALLLDWSLPDGTAEDVLRWVRDNQGWEVGIVVLTARDDEQVVVQALQSGADDYVVKPPKQRELVARLAAAARRARPAPAPQVTRLGAYEADLLRNVLSVDGVGINLTQKEFDLAAYLLQSPGKLLSRDHLLNKVWGFNADVDTRTVDTHVSRLRKKLAMDGRHGWKLFPVYGYGYRFDRADAVEARAA